MNAKLTVILLRGGCDSILRETIISHARWIDIGFRFLARHPFAIAARERELELERKREKGGEININIF